MVEPIRFANLSADKSLLTADKLDRTLKVNVVAP
jgi:hypothetical protein